MTSINLVDHLLQIVRVSVFAEDNINLLNSPLTKSYLLTSKFQALEAVLTQNKMEITSYPKELQERFYGMIDDQKKQIDEYPIIILNQSLSILCSLFENFLVQSLDAIFSSKIETLIGLSEQKIITLKDIIKCGSYESIIIYFKDKVLKAFSRSSTEEQFEDYFGHLGFDVSKFFDMSKYKDGLTFKDWDLKKLISIFGERHDIVHYEKKPIKSIEELSLRRQFFDKLIMNIAIEINIKFGITNDLNLPQVLALLKK